jgi:hypothetical protein
VKNDLGRSFKSAKFTSLGLLFRVGEFLSKVGCMVLVLTNLFEGVLPVPKCVSASVADPDPVGSGPFWSVPDLDFWDRIQIRFRILILALIKDSISAFLMCVKALNTLGTSAA